MLGENGSGREFWGRKLTMKQPIVLSPVERSFHLVKAVMRPLTVAMATDVDLVQLLVDTGAPSSHLPKEEVELHRFVDVTTHTPSEKRLGCVFKRGCSVTFSLEGFLNNDRDYELVTVDLIGHYLEDDDEGKALDTKMTLERMELYAKNVILTQVIEMEEYASAAAGEGGDACVEAAVSTTLTTTSLREELKRSQDEVLTLEQKVKQLEMARMMANSSGEPPSVPTIVITDTSDNTAS